MNEREIFDAAREIDDAQHRAQFLSRACADNSVSQQRIESLLEADQASQSILDWDDAKSTADWGITETIGQTIGNYKLLEQIGSGGFGVVFMAEQIAPVRRTVALKVIKPGMDSRQVIARFEAERQALAMMDHPNIARVLDAGTTQTGRPYFVMELVRGVPITRFCDQRKADLSERLTLFTSVCQAIQHAHNKGIIHRDIKPGNVLVAMYDDHPVAKVIDFGVAKATGGQLTEKTLHTGYGSIVGSLEYMSPEQASFNQLDVDTRSDVYSLGVLLYELLAGAPPFSIAELRKAGVLESLKMIRESDPMRPSTRLSSAEGLAELAANRKQEPARLTSIIRGELDWIVMKALEKERSRRYQTVGGLSEEVSRFLRGEPVEAHPPSQWYRLRKWSTRRWRGLVLAAVCFSILLALAGAYFQTWNHRQDQIAEHSQRLSEAIGDASQLLGKARSAAIGQNADWVAARTQASRVRELLQLQSVNESVQGTAQEFLTAFAQADSDRRLAEHIENVIILSATRPDLESWNQMERQFAQLFESQGMNPADVAPQEFADWIRAHHSAEQLCDALELWIGTKGQISALGGERATARTMQPLADALLAADDDPVRSGIRRLMYSGVPFDGKDVDSVVHGVELSSLTPRTLSWLANVYMIAKQQQRADEVFYIAVDQYPDDFMLNFDFAYMLVAQQRWSEAIRYHLRCTALRPEVSGVWHGLGNCFLNNNELDRSEEALKRAVRLAPTHGKIWVELAQVQNKLERFPDAEKSAKTAIDTGVETPYSRYCLAEALHGQNQLAEALMALEECEKLNLAHPRETVDIESLKAEIKQKLSNN